ncbi:MAG: response regulator [Gammaproteobacteria bacterium]|nr:response regulator [Gammaproteobacteria bacterium]
MLIVEDEIKLANILRDYLQQSGYETQIIDNGLDVITSVQQDPPTLILLDLMLPGKDGISVCKELRQFSDIPVIMVTARVEEIDRLLGLELGADDYICKPFSPREVVARVKAVLRRFITTSPTTDKPISMDEETLQTSLYGHQIELTAIEFRLLQTMAKRPGRIFSRAQLLDNLYEDSRIVSDRTIDSHIKKLRKKISNHIEQEVIHSIYSVGYKFQLD